MVNQIAENYGLTSFPVNLIGSLLKERSAYHKFRRNFKKKRKTKEVPITTINRRTLRKVS